jgi:hypothetical protein
MEAEAIRMMCERIGEINAFVVCQTFYRSVCMVCP